MRMDTVCNTKALSSRSCSTHFSPYVAHAFFFFLKVGHIKATQACVLASLLDDRSSGAPRVEARYCL